VRDRGSEGYLREAERQESLQWIGAQETVSVETVRAYGEERYGGVYHSTQSYYELREAGGMSYHRTEKSNPKRDAAQVLARREESKKTGDALGRDSAGGGESPGGGRLSLTVGRCLGKGVGQTAYPD